MPRTIEVSLAAPTADRLVAELQKIDGVVSIRRDRGVSVRPPGDVVSACTTDEGITEVQRILDRLELGDDATVSTSEPQSVIAQSYEDQLDDETNEATLEEMAWMLRRETNITNNYVMAMAFAGGVAAAGLWTDTLHIVVGAAVIAPGFEPILRIPFGLIAMRKPRLRRGLLSTAVGYGALFLGALLTTWLFAWSGLGAEAASERQWLQYWSTIKPSGVLIALLASAAGMAIVAAQRSVLSAGVMIAIGLVPGMAICGMGVALGDFALAGGGLLRWSVDAVAVIAAGAAVLGLKRVFYHRRASLG